MIKTGREHKSWMLFGLVAILMPLLLANPLWGQAGKGVQPLPNSVTRDGISVALAKLERKGGEVTVWIAFKKVGDPPVGEEIEGFSINIRDDRGNMYPLDPSLGTLHVPLSLGADIKLFPLGFTWIKSAAISMPPAAPVQSVVLNIGKTRPQKYYNKSFPIFLDPRSARLLTIDFEVVHKNDITGKKFNCSRDIIVWFGQPLWRQQGQSVLYRLPVYVHNKDYNTRNLDMSYFKYYLYLESGEVVPLYVDPSVDPGVKRRGRLFHFGGVDNSEWEIPAATTVEGRHVLKPEGPFTGKPVAIMVEIKGRSLGFLPLGDKRESASAWIVTRIEGSYNDITYANGLFVAVGQSGVILTSTDGKNWTNQSSGVKQALSEYVRKPEDVTHKAVAYGNGLFVVLSHYDPGSGMDSFILCSPDGNQWRRHWWGDGQFNSVSYGNGVFVAVGWYNRILSSSDGKEWAQNEAVIKEHWQRVERLQMGTDHFNGVTYGNGLFVVVGGVDQGALGLIRTSPDGKNWTRQMFNDGYLTDVTYGNGLFVAVGEAGLIMTSTDGRNWSRQMSGTKERLTSVSYGDGLFVAVGEWGVILTSPDGYNWTLENSGTNKDLRGIAYGNGLFVVVGDGVVLTLRLGEVSDTSRNAPAGAQELTVAIEERLPVKVGGKVVFVVPLAELPSGLQEKLKGKVAFAVVDEQGEVPRDLWTIYKALISWHVARSLLDDPDNPGWDMSRSESVAGSFEARAEVLMHILIQQGAVDVLEQTSILGARWLLIGVVAGKVVPISVPKALVQAFIDQALMNPKNVARLFVSWDLAVAAGQLYQVAQLLRSLRGYPLDSEVALKLFEVDALDAPLGAEAALQRLKIAGSLEKHLLDLGKDVLTQLERLLRDIVQPNVAFVGEFAATTAKFFSVLSQVEGWNDYQAVRERIIVNWMELVSNYLEMARAIHSVAEVPQASYQAELLWQRNFEDFPIWHVAVSPDGRFLAVAGGSEYLSGGIHLIRAVDGASLKFFDFGEGNYASKVSFSHDGKLLAGEKGHYEVMVWRVDDGTLVKKFEGSFVSFSREGDLIAIARDGFSRSAIIEVRSVRDGSLRRRIELPFRRGGNYALSSDWGLVAEASEKSVRLWRIEQRRVEFLWEAQVNGLGKLAFSPDGRLVAVVYDVIIENVRECGGLQKVQQNMVVLQVRDGTVAWKFATKFECDSPDSPPSSGAVFSPDGKYLALAGRDGIIRVWEVESRKIVTSFKMSGAYSLAFSGDGNQLVAGALTVPGEVRLWRVRKK